MCASRFIYEIFSKDLVDKELEGRTEEILFYAEFNLNCILLLRFRDELALNHRAAASPLPRTQQLAG